MAVQLLPVVLEGCGWWAVTGVLLVVQKGFAAAGWCTLTVMRLMGGSCTASWWVPGIMAVTPVGWKVVNGTWLLFCM